MMFTKPNIRDGLRQKIKIQIKVTRQKAIFKEKSDSFIPISTMYIEFQTTRFMLLIILYLTAKRCYE
jgi:hypothetical protein